MNDTEDKIRFPIVNPDVRAIYSKQSNPLTVAHRLRQAFKNDGRCKPPALTRRCWHPLIGTAINAGRSFMKSLTLWLLTGMAVVWVAPVQTAADTAFGPLVQEFGLTLENGRRIEAAGPFYYHEQGEAHTEWALPPFFARRYDLGADKLSIDILWKLASYDRMGPESKFNLLQLFSFGGGRSLADEGDRKLTLFPFYFHNRSDNPERDYSAVMPFYGTLRNRLFRDEIKWVMFPLYVQTRKRDVVTDNYVLPLFHLRHGDELKGWQLWPLIGREKKGLTTRTNLVGDVIPVGPHEKSFYLWPVFLKSHTGIGQPNETLQRAVLPLYYAQRSEARDVTAVLWPFFTHTDDRARDYREWGLPYPFVMFAKGPGKTGGRVWPLYGQAHNDTLRTRFVLGPLYRSKEVTSGNLHRFRWNSLYFLYDSLDETNTETGKTFRRRGFTPFYHYVEDRQGNESLQILAPLETALPNSDSLRRSLSPLWSVWRSQKNPAAGKSSQSLLWNLYRRDTSPEVRRTSALFGLFRWEKHASGERALRLFYLPKLTVGRGEPANAALEPAQPSTP